MPDDYDTAHIPFAFGLHLGLGVVTIGPGEVLGVYSSIPSLLRVPIVPSPICAWRSGVRSKAQLFPRHEVVVCLPAFPVWYLVWHGMAWHG